VQLIRPDRTQLEAAARDGAVAAALGCDVVPGWATSTEQMRVSPTGPWGARFFVVDGELVGWGGFKGPPVEGAVEVGYEIAASRQGRGLATAAVREMLAEAFADPAVTVVLAHTLPEPNASNHLLRKAGFRFAGDRHVRGMAVWRFALTVPR
jgi:RimJ/RimL family protein N-acetyltransferase